MQNKLMVNDTDLQVKVWNGQRVVTLADIDKVHKRPDGTARRNFNTNKKNLLENEDYYRVCADEIRTRKIMDISSKAHDKITLLTESGYLLLVKSFTDKLAWEVQRKLVNSYFKLRKIEPTVKEVLVLQNDLKVVFAQINNMESLLEQQLEQFEQTRAELNKVMDNMTLTTVQQEKIHKLAKDRVNYLLGGAHSQEYKAKSRMYFINLWNGLKSTFSCGSRWQDLNPVCYEEAIGYIKSWEYIN